MESREEHFGRVTIQQIVNKGESIINTVDDVIKNDVIKRIVRIPQDIKDATVVVTDVIDDIKDFGDQIVTAVEKIDDIANTIENEVKDISKGAGRFINDTVKSAKKEVLYVASEVKDLTDDATKLMNKTIHQIESAGLKIGKEIERELNKAVDFIKKQEKFIETKIKNGIDQISEKFKFLGSLFGDWYGIVMDYIKGFLNSVIDFIENVYFVFTFCGYWIALTLLFVLYGTINIWSVFGEFNTPARYIIFYSVMYYLYTLDYFTLHVTLDPKEMIKNFINFFKNFSSSIQDYWKQFDNDVRAVYFIFVSYFYAILVSFLILLTGFVVPVFDVAGKDYSVYLRNVAFYAIMYYMYNNQMFSLPAVDNPVTAVENFFKNLSDPQSFFKNLGDGVLNIIQDVFFVILFVMYWVLLTFVFLTYDSFNIWEVFGEDYSWYVKNIAFYSIMFALYNKGYFDITESVSDLYTRLTTTSWSDLCTSAIQTFQLIYFVIISFGFAIVISTLIIFLSLTPLFNLLGEDNAIYLRHVFFYAMLTVIYNSGYMTLPSSTDITKIDVWSYLKNIQA